MVDVKEYIKKNKSHLLEMTLSDLSEDELNYERKETKGILSLYEDWLECMNNSIESLVYEIILNNTFRDVLENVSND